MIRYKAFKPCIYIYTCTSLQVTYDTTGFLEKNRDLLHLDSIQLLSSCTRDLPQTFASYMLTNSEKPVVGPLHKSGGADSQKLSVTTKFKVHLIFTVVFIWFQYQFCGLCYIFLSLIRTLQLPESYNMLSSL